jgi:hypothetical protein
MPNSLEAKRMLHALADEKNVIGTRWGRDVLLCGAENRSKPGGYCRALAGFRTEHQGYGRCIFCGGASTGPRTEEGKAAASQNSRKHGFYSAGLSIEEQAAYQELREEAKALTLEEEIYVQKAKIRVYLVNWRKKWDSLYKRKLAEKFIKYRCKNPECDQTVAKGELDGKPGYCLKCGHLHLEKIDSRIAERTPEEAEAYADSQTRVWYSEGEGARSYYHAGSLEDRTLDRALNTLGRLVEKHARLNPDGGEDLISQINAELRAATKGKIAVSWSGPAQQRMAEKPENSAGTAGK